MAYIIILPDPDWRHRCRHRGGDPDCSCFPECPECGTIYTPTDGHDCLDDVPADELLDAAKELRDSLDACETERDRLRAQIAALQSVPQGVEVPEIPVDVLSSIEQDHSCEEWDWRAPAITAWFRRNARNPAVRVEVPPYPDVLVRQSIGHTERHAGIMEGVEWARKNARLVPTPPQDATGAQITFSQPETSPYLICDHCGGEMALTDGWVPTYSNPDNQGCNPSAEPYCPKCDAPHPLQPEERRMGPDEVVVPRSAAEYAILAFDWIECPDSEHYEALRSFHDALRTSAQAHNGEESK